MWLLSFSTLAVIMKKVVLICLKLKKPNYLALGNSAFSKEIRGFPPYFHK